MVHRAQWLRHKYGAALYRKGEEGNTFHIIAQGRIDVYRDGQRVAQLSPNCRHLFDEGFIRVLVRRLHAAHEALAHPRRIL